MQIEAAVVFPASSATVFAMMSDANYVRRKAEAMGALEHDVEVTLLGTGGATITLHRTLPSMVPDFVRPFVGETIEVVQTEDWGPAHPDGSRTGQMHARIANAPVRLTGHITLAPTGPASSIHRVDADVSAKVPFVGGKIERAIGEVILMAARKEEEVGSAWLAEQS